MRSFIRTLWSKSKRRYTDNGFNLDLTYITPRLLAMACPAEGPESLFRNPMPEVLRFLTTFHHNHFKVINLCAERYYDPVKLGGNVERIPIEDHQPAPLSAIFQFCVAAEAWLAAHEDNVLVAHCKAGKGRTGMMLSAYLLYSRYCPDSAAALLYYAEHRTKNGKGVTLPSQRRYVGYFAEMVRNEDCRIRVHKLQLTDIRYTSTSHCKADVHIVVSCNGGGGSYKLDTVFSTLDKGSVMTVSKGRRSVCLGVRPTWVAGDVKVEFFEHKLRRRASLFYTCFNTLFIESGEFAVASKAELDRPARSLDTNFQVVFHFSHRPLEQNESVAKLKDPPPCPAPSTPAPPVAGSCRGR